MTPLRQRMLEDMEMRNLASSTKKLYVSKVAQFAKHFNKSPDQLGAEEIRTYLLSLVRKGASWSQFNIARCALHFFFRVTLKREFPKTEIVCAKNPKKLPVVLSQSEVVQFLATPTKLKHRAILSTLYAAGLRVSELVELRVADIDSKRMVIRVRQGKGKKDRYVMLSPKLLTLLREYWQKHRPKEWLFPRREEASQHVSKRYVELLCTEMAKKSKLDKAVSPHTLRHSFATHLLENGENIRKIQMLLGHRNVQTTARYTHVSMESITATNSPFDLLESNTIMAKDASPVAPVPEDQKPSPPTTKEGGES